MKYHKSLCYLPLSDTETALQLFIFTIKYNFILHDLNNDLNEK